MNADILTIALGYHARNWSIIPIEPGTKKPRRGFRWKQFQTDRPDEADLREWFANGDAPGMAVIFGAVSGGLICRDFDRLDAYTAWATAHPDLAQTLPTVETGRPGMHVYCRGDIALIQQASKSGSAIIPFADGELRGGGYCLLPPSTHPSGHVYRWVVPLPAGELPFVDLRESGFLNLGPATEKTETTESNRENTEHRDTRDNGVEQKTPETTETTDDSCAVSGVSVALCCTDNLDGQIERAILDAMPTGPGQRNKQVFQLARALKAIPAIADAPANDLEPYVRRWHDRAKRFITSKEFEESWIDFLRAWRPGAIKFPKGSKPVLQLLFDRAVCAGVPDVALHYDGEKCRLLVGLCRELQRATGSAPFYLSCRTAGNLLGVEHSTAWRWLFLFTVDGILEIVSRGSQASHKASRFKYLAEI